MLTVSNRRDPITLQMWPQRVLVCATMSVTKVRHAQGKEGTLEDITSFGAWLKRVPIKGMIGDELPFAAYLEQMRAEARTERLAGRGFGHQLRLLLLP